MESYITEFRDGIFALRTRRFGDVSELMIETLFNLSDPLSLFHDRFDTLNKKRIEIKFSTVMKENKETIKMENVIAQCKEANLANRMMASYEIRKEKFDCNIQQVKRAEFDILFYGLFFKDKIAIFKIGSDDILKCLGYSDKQHKGNIGEGQFHLNQKTIDYHFKKWFIKWVTYEELYNAFQRKRLELSKDE